jgi:hypothetical protein
MRVQKLQTTLNYFQVTMITAASLNAAQATAADQTNQMVQIR